jgi:hypothetical protein
VTFSSPISNRPLTIYCLRWKFAPNQVVLNGGQNYWLSVFLEGTGVITEEAFFLCKRDDACHIKITQARYLSAPFTVSTWEEIAPLTGGPRDLAFRILVRETLDSTSTNATTNGTFGATGNRLIGDLDANGTVDISDLVEVLNSFGAGK